MSNKHKKKLSIEQKGFRIISVAALCFSIVSWKATSDGLNNNGFSGWQALMVSFGIQSILFVINMKLPSYIQRIPYSKYEYSGWNPIKIIWKLIKNIILNLRFFIIVFYIMILLSSSIFSYIYIANSTYKDTRYYDAHIELDENFQLYCSEAQDYVDRYSEKILQDITREIQIIDKAISTKYESEVTTTKSELEEELSSKMGDLELLKIDVAESKSKYDEALRRSQIPDTETWRSPSEHEREQQEVETTGKDYHDMQRAQTTLENEIKDLENKINNYKEPIQNLTKNFILELSGEHDIDEMQRILSELYDEAMENGSEISDTVSQIQQLSSEVEGYKQLESAKKRLNSYAKSQRIPIPDSKSESKEISTWIEYWSGRYEDLMIELENLPNNSMNIAESDSFIKNNQAYKEKITELYTLQRNFLYNISDIERAYNYFRSNYPLLSFFSLAFAIFLDLASLMVGLFLYYMSNTDKNPSHS